MDQLPPTASHTVDELERLIYQLDQRLQISIDPAEQVDLSNRLSEVRYRLLPEAIDRREAQREAAKQRQLDHYRAERKKLLEMDQAGEALDQAIIDALEVLRQAVENDLAYRKELKAQAERVSKALEDYGQSVGDAPGPRPLALCGLTLWWGDSVEQYMPAIVKRYAMLAAERARVKSDDPIQPRWIGTMGIPSFTPGKSAPTNSARAGEVFWRNPGIPSNPTGIPNRPPARPTGTPTRPPARPK